MFVLNVKNFIKRGEEVDVVTFHKTALSDVGFVEEQDVIIQTPNMGFGKNRELRVNGEHIVKFRKPV